MKKLVPGLSLIELMFTIVLVSAATLTLVRLQSVLFRNTFSTHALIERIILIKNAFCQADRDGWYKDQKSHTNSIEDPQTTILSSITPITAPAALASFPTLFKEEVTAQWSDILGSREENFVTFKFNPQGAGK
jgi:Tfp pilus assembly protein PilV